MLFLSSLFCLSEYSCISLSFFIIAVWNSLSCSSVFRDFELASGDFPFAIRAVALVAQDIPWIASLSRHRGVVSSVLCVTVLLPVIQQVGVSCFPVNGAAV